MDHDGRVANWYPDPHGGAGVRWWDGDRWTEDVRDEHPRRPGAGDTPRPAPIPVAVPAPDPAGGAGTFGTSRIVVSRVRPRNVGGPAYVFQDGDGLPRGTMVERPPSDGSRPGERAATLDLFDETGDPVLRLTCDPHLVGEACAALGWGPLQPWGYLVLGPDLAPVAWAQAPPRSNRGGQVYRLGTGIPSRQVHCLGVEAPIELRDQRVGTGRKAPRPATMGGVPVGQITVVSGWGAPDTYVLDLFHGAPEGGLATTLAALVPMYDQIFRAVSPARFGGSSFD